MIQRDMQYGDQWPGNFRKLPPDVLHRFSQLAKLAYEKLTYNELVFEVPDKDNFDHMGFMTVLEENSVTSGTHCTYNYLHLSIQEYLAECHICQMGDKCELRNNIDLTFYDEQLTIIERDLEECKSDLCRNSDLCVHDTDGLDVLDPYTWNIGAFIYGFLHEKLKDVMMYV